MTPTSNTSAIARAIAELETEKANLAARAAKVDEAIGVMRALFHLPDAKSAPRARSNGNGDGHHADPAVAIRAALAHGPLSPAALAAAVGLDRAALRYRIRQLEAEGAIVSSGTTASRRVALAAKAAKEAP